MLITGSLLILSHQTSKSSHGIFNLHFLHGDHFVQMCRKFPALVGSFCRKPFFLYHPLILLHNYAGRFKKYRKGHFKTCAFTEIFPALSNACGRPFFARVMPNFVYYTPSLVNFFILFFGDCCFQTQFV